MTENVLQLIWQHRLYSEPLYTNEGKRVEVVNTGVLNANAGPDFTDVTIKIDDVSFTGAVEVHSRASDWFVHNHQNDERYNNVILHVVEVDDARVEQAMYQSALTITQQAVEVAHELAVFPNSVRCFKYWKLHREELSRVLMENIPVWLEERLKQRANEIIEYKRLWNSSIDEVLYFRLMRTLGSAVNQQPFERLARTVTLEVLNSSFFGVAYIEAMLLGVAGFIPNNSDDEYAKQLQTIYEGLKEKFSFVQMPPHLWKTGRFRPLATPVMRIVQFSSFLKANKKYLSAKLLSAQNPKDIIEIFSCDVSPYWQTHYTLGGVETKPISKAWGGDFKKSLIINAIAPVIYAQGVEEGSENAMEKARELLRSVSCEKNNVMDDWKELLSADVRLKGADKSQALIHLRTKYCERKDCLRCPICHYLLRY